MLKLLKTKTTWAGLAAICVAIGGGVSGSMSWFEAIQGIILGVAIIFGRAAIAKIGK